MQAYQRQLDLARIEALEYERELMRRRMKILVHENQSYPPDQGGSSSSPLVSPRPSGSSDGRGGSGTYFYAPFDADQSPINTDIHDLPTAHNLRVVATSLSASERDEAQWQTRSDELRSREHDGRVGETDTALGGGALYGGRRRHLSVHTARQHLPGVRDPSEPPLSEQRTVGNPAANASHSERAEWLLRAQSSGSRRRAQQQLLHVPRRRAEEAQVHVDEAARRASIASHESRIEELQKKVPVGLSFPSSTHEPNEISPIHTVPPSRHLPRGGVQHVSPTPLSPHSLPTSTSTRVATAAPPPTRSQTGQHVRTQRGAAQHHEDRHGDEGACVGTDDEEEIAV